MMTDIREFGNIAGHPAQDKQGDWTAIDSIVASYTLDIVAEVLDHIFVKPAPRLKMRKRWESKKHGGSPLPQNTNQIVVGDREPPFVEPITNDDDCTNTWNSCNMNIEGVQLVIRKCTNDINHDCFVIGSVFLSDGL